jgi:hypothetical protein
MIHRTNVQRYNGSFAEMVNEFSDLRYDALAEFLVQLAIKLQSDAMLDKGRGRVRLASALQISSEKLTAAATCIQEAWRICEPHMPETKL